jgi:hypothetical protein
MGFRIEKNAEPIPGYRLLEPLGRGGFGEVWKCEAPGCLLKAIKFVFGNLEDQGDRRRTDQELRALARVRGIRHPFLLSLERYDIVEGQLAIVMELADRDLMQRFRECRKRGLTGIPRPELLRYLEEAAEVLDLMNHEHDLQHLDVKPQNLCLLHNHVKVADFGLVKDLTGLVASVTGGITPKYAPPETFNGVVSRFSDQYSLALVYHELLTGRGPYAFGNLQEIMLQHTEGTPDLSALSEKEQAVVARALAKDPDRRHSCCRAFAEALRRLDEPHAVPVAAPDHAPFAEQLTTVHTPTPPSERFSATSVGPAGIALPSCHEAGPPPPATDEADDGVLIPALVVGLGGFGLDVLRRFRKGMQARFGDPSRFPSLRLLAIDTDPQAVSQAQQAPPGEALEREELLPARLARASRYLRPREPLPPLGDWLPPRVLHRISRYQGTSGYRALGRLAFIENYRAIVTTLRRRLEQVGDPQGLTAASDDSGLPPRSGKLRVYVVAGLAGGTGSGMLVDVAYVVRALLRELGTAPAEVFGMLLLPPGGQRPDTMMQRANGYAALAELAHFADPGSAYQAQHDSQAPVLTDVNAPFDRCFLLNPPGQAGGGDPVCAAADYLYLHLLTPLGREADAARRACPDPRAADGPLPLQMFGVDIRFSPGRRLLRQGARRLARTLLEQWTQGSPKNLAHVRQEVQDRLHDQKLDGPNLLAQMQKSCARTLGYRPEQIFHRWLEPISGPAARFDHRHAARLLLQADEFFGHPDREREVGLQVPPLVGAVRQAAEEAGDLARDALGRMAIAFLERPGPRLGLAVDALKLASAQVERWLQAQDTHLAQASGRVKKLRQRVESGVFATERAARTGEDLRRYREELRQLLAEYPAACYQHQLAVGLRGVYLGVRGILSDQVRDVAFYRQPLEYLHQALAEAEEKAAQDPSGPGRLLPAAFSPSGESLLGAEESLQLDRAVQQALREHPAAQCALWEVTASARGVKLLGDILVRQAEKFLRQRLPADDAADLFLAQGPEEELAQRLRQAFAAAGPMPLDVPRGAAPELALAMAPASRAGARLLDAARAALPELKPILSDRAEEIVFYREALGLGLGELERLGLLDREAYRQICAREQDAAHARVDILPRGN